MIVQNSNEKMWSSLKEMSIGMSFTQVRVFLIFLFFMLFVNFRFVHQSRPDHLLNRHWTRPGGFPVKETTQRQRVKHVLNTTKPAPDFAFCALLCSKICQPCHLSTTGLGSKPTIANQYMTKNCHTQSNITENRKIKIKKAPQSTTTTKP